MYIMYTIMYYVKCILYIKCISNFCLAMNPLQPHMRRILRTVQSNCCRGFGTRPSNFSKQNIWMVPTGAAVSVVCAGVLLKIKAEEKKTRLYTLNEFNEMVANGRIVVALAGDLYDMTNFSGHPGGVGRLQMAAGNDLAVYWSVYTQHNRGHIR